MCVSMATTAQQVRSRGINHGTNVKIIKSMRISFSLVSLSIRETSPMLPTSSETEITFRDNQGINKNFKLENFKRGTLPYMIYMYKKKSIC